MTPESLVPKVKVKFSWPSSADTIVLRPRRYTREAGVRSLERKIAAICRAVAVKVAEGHGVTTAEELTSECPPQQGGRRTGSSLTNIKGEHQRHTGVCHFLFPVRAAPPELPIVIDHMALSDILGPPLFDLEVSCGLPGAPPLSARPHGVLCVEGV